MKTKVRPCNKILIGLGVLILGALAVSSVSCNQQARSIPPQGSAIARHSATPGQPLTRAPLTATGATTTPAETARLGTPVTASASTRPAQIGTPTTTPTPTGEQLALAELQRRHAWCDSSCQATRQAQGMYTEYGSPQRITHREWDTLLPKTEFYLVPYASRYAGEWAPYNELFAFHDGQWYDADTFDRLLSTNNIVITDENRELVAKAFALMTIPGYLKEGVVFTEWKIIDPNAQRSSEPYNYCLRSWAKLGGQELAWCYVFQKERLDIASGPIVGKSGVGDYIETSPGQIPFLYYKDYRFPGGTP